MSCLAQSVVCLTPQSPSNAGGHKTVNPFCPVSGTQSLLSFRSCILEVSAACYNCPSFSAFASVHFFSWCASPLVCPSRPVLARHSLTTQSLQPSDSGLVCGAPHHLTGSLYFQSFHCDKWDFLPRFFYGEPQSRECDVIQEVLIIQ